MPSGQSPLHILVVDDNADCAETTAMLLRAYGHCAATAIDGAAALKAAEQHRPDVVLLDLALPGMSGWELAQQIRQQAEGATPVLIAVTGLVRQEDRQHSAESGIDLHLVKPVEPAHLRDLLSNLRDGKAFARSSPSIN